ncbi:class I SAM-dependent methyltransferase [Paenisporosarcina cavernae]|uniref:Class I SAM-dependent methyltransferase n=1 Tax=Paenisporosarcina cavernae TaxID=2320858 RepID=A0A385YRJ9_9BACL|nr:class I SAM-dependent methyltransferase [Paenisporosarcina cavernae]AYC28627.1 class I SAM-dependent methyltransferase [Paenisporosarcina cavernae]
MDDFSFDLEMAKEYDKGIRRAMPTYDALFRMTQSFMRAHLSEKADLLIVGAGSGNEVTIWGPQNPNWHFTGVDPSEEMLEVAAYKVKELQMDDRAQWVAGYLHDVSLEKMFDAATCMLVLHFVETREGKRALLQQIYDALKPGAPFVMSCMYGNTSSKEFANRLQHWKLIWLDLTNLDQEDVDAMAESVSELPICEEEEIESLLEEVGFEHVTKFFSTTLFGAWSAVKK